MTTEIKKTQKPKNTQVVFNDWKQGLKFAYSKLQEQEVKQQYKK